MYATDKIKIVSLVIPIYNGSPYLHTLLESILIQFHDDCELKGLFQIILSLDSPTDGSDKIAKEYASCYPDIFTVIEHENVGLVENRNIGMRAATGEYLMWADHDDEFKVGAFRQIIDVIKRETPDIINFGMEYIDKNGNYRGGCNALSTNILPRDYNMSVKTGWWMLWTNVIKRTIIEENNIYPDKRWLTEDVDLRVKAYFHARGVVAVINQPLYRWRILGSSTSHNSQASIKYLQSGIFYLFNHLNYSLKNGDKDRRYWTKVLKKTAKINFTLASKLPEEIIKSAHNRSRLFLKFYIKHYGIVFSSDFIRLFISSYFLKYAPLIWGAFEKINNAKSLSLRKLKEVFK